MDGMNERKAVKIVPRYTNTELKMFSLKQRSDGYNHMGVERCKKCIHWSPSECWCNYILDTGHSRGCPPNNECEVFVSTKKSRLKRSFGKSIEKWDKEDVSQPERE